MKGNTSGYGLFRIILGRVVAGVCSCTVNACPHVHALHFLQTVAKFRTQEIVACRWAGTCPQAERENKHRVGTLGAAFSAEEKLRFVSKTLEFVRRKRAQIAGLPMPKRMRKAVAQEPRKASLAWLADFENCMESSWGKTWANFLPDDRPWDDAYKADEGMPELLVATFDQHQVQWCASYFMERKLRANMVLWNGHFHRRANDMERAILRSGKTGVMHRALTWLNIGYGP